MINQEKLITCNGLRQYVTAAKDKGQTQADIARAAGIDGTTLSRILRGRRLPTSREMAMLSRVFNKGLDELFEVKVQQGENDESETGKY